MAERKLRVLVGKPGLDGHDRGAKIIARAFRDSGFEVIYTGLHQTPEQIVSASIQEDVDCIALSILSGAHNTLLPAVSDLLKEKGADDIVLMAGGVIPEEDIPGLKAAGIREVFTPGTSTETIVAWVRDNVSPHSEA
jgi:methylmalonyl-CoA mutase C-terminal domain/subunit